MSLEKKERRKKTPRNKNNELEKHKRGKKMKNGEQKMSLVQFSDDNLYGDLLTHMRFLEAPLRISSKNSEML